jgi:hypothetical protein
MNLITTAFLFYFAGRVWQIGARKEAFWTAVVTLVGCVIAFSYDFFPWSFDDADRTWFYITALTTWGTQGFVYFFAYRKLHEHNQAMHPAATEVLEGTA